MDQAFWRTSLTHGTVCYRESEEIGKGKKRDLFAESSLKKPDKKDGEDAEEEGEDGGEEEAPPLPLLQALLLPEDGNTLGSPRFHHHSPICLKRGSIFRLGVAANSKCCKWGMRPTRSPGAFPISAFQLAKPAASQSKVHCIITFALSSL